MVEGKPWLRIKDDIVIGALNGLLECLCCTVAGRMIEVAVEVCGLIMDICSQPIN